MNNKKDLKERNITKKQKIMKKPNKKFFISF